MTEAHYVVVGNGPAGAEAALTLREEAPRAKVSLIGKSREGSYRPHLLPDWISGKISEDALAIHPTDTFKEKEIKLRRGQKVVSLNLTDRSLVLDHKEIVPFTGVIVAAGGKPRIPEPLRVFRDLFLTLKTLEDARVWKERLAQTDSILMMGGDLTAFAFTRALLGLKKKVCFMLDEDAFWPLRCDKALLEEAGHALSRRGVEVLLGRRLKGLSRVSDRLLEVQLDGERIRVGIIGAFFGLVPHIRFLSGSGLRIDRGILVDETLNAGPEGVYATGDCAQIYHPQLRDYWVSIGHDNAVELGRAAARNLLGGRVKAEPEAESIFEVKGIRVNTSWWTEF
jgi:NAD(P)H-nitrite reductase large subunit